MKQNLQKKTTNLLSKLNLSKWIASHLIGENHSSFHRKIVGIFIMIFGVGLTKIYYLVHFESLNFLADIVGYGFHGLGLIPFIKSIE